MSEARHGGLTYADLERMPDDGNRYELVDGELVVVPSASWEHQGIVGSLIVALRAACPATLRVRTAPLDVLLADGTSVQPDLLVAAADKRRPVAGSSVVLLVEITSPDGGMRRDRGWKLRRYEANGIPHYWIVDPDPVAPALTALTLTGGRYVRTAMVIGAEVFRATDPFPVGFAPADLLD